jgi:hypothetical protein
MFLGVFFIRFALCSGKAKGSIETDAKNALQRNLENY